MRFTHPTDYDTMLHLNKEFVNDLIDTTVIIYKLNVKKTKTNSYNEATTKTWYAGVTIPALVRLEKEQPTAEMESININQKLQVGLLHQELSDRGFMAEIGDIVEWDQQYYEINTTNDVQFWGGRVAYRHSLVCSCHLTRQSTLQLEKPQK